MIYFLIIPVNRKRKLKIKLKIPEELDSNNVVSYITVRLKDKGLKSHLVHACTEGPPKDTKPPGKNMLWCPYCRDWRKFVLARYNPDLRICEICGISTKDFDVRKFNHLWDEVLSGIKRRKENEEERK